MKLYPAIDILDNRAVRLLYGKRDNVTDYGTPIERAEMWINEGAEYLHLVDLNGAFDTSLTNENTLKELIRRINKPVQIGGGIKSFERVKYYLEEIGADSVIIGSALVTDPDMAEKSYAKYGNKIVAGIDAMNNKVCIKGWVEESDLTPLELALKMKEYGAERVVFTDISRDGALSGVNVKATADLQAKTNLNIIASGGMRSLNDIEMLIKEGIYGAILGRAIYTGDIELNRAIKLSKAIN